MKDPCHDKLDSTAYFIFLFSNRNASFQIRAVSTTTYFSRYFTKRISKVEAFKQRDIRMENLIAIPHKLH